MTLTPADLAQLDQAHAEGNADLDRLIRKVRTLIRRHGITLGTAAFTAELQTDRDPLYLAAVAALAISRLAQQDVPTAPTCPASLLPCIKPADHGGLHQTAQGVDWADPDQED